ncbi:MAG: Gfo/Idh/MocA family oxidoreductase [Lentisphaerae bacterium]|nr:Gfo/Idh/MocA family oxidoreductase [Lentisphaerota bacterium]
MHSTSQPIRVGLVGAGANTRARHIPGLRALEGVSLASVANRTRASSERVAREFGIPAVYDSWEELVRAPDSDAVVIGTWPYLHGPATLAALAAGKHVLCEARMAMNAAEAGRMLAAARAHPERVAQVVPSPLTLHVDNTVIRLVRDGALGRLLAVEVRSATGAFLDPEAPLHWRQDADLSGNNMLTLGIWYEALMRWVGEAVTVSARAKTFVASRRDPRTGTDKPVQLPDHLAVLADLACGAQADMVFSAVAGHAAANEATLFGTDATLRFRDGALSLARRGDTAFSAVPVPPAEAGGWRVEADFVAAIRGGPPVTRTTFADGVRYMAFTDAVARSLATGRTEPIPDALHNT